VWSNSSRRKVKNIGHVKSSIYHFKGERAKAINHLEATIAIVSPFDWHDQLFWIRCSLVVLFLDQHKFHSAHTQVDEAKSHAIDSAYHLGRTIHMQAVIWYRQGQLKEAKSAILRASETFEKLQAAKDLETCRAHLQNIERATGS
jgi:hypothetical protein